MSRCFPFPPPGYEKKPTTEDINLLKKEKLKEKQHKKDKKDTEKRESKEKREDKSDGKHKDKKDKHRDKKKDKENGKEKEKGKRGTSDDTRVNGRFEGYNGEKLYQKDEQTRERNNSLQFQNGKYNEQIHKKEESKCSSSDDKSCVQFWGQNGESQVRNRIKAGDTENSKFVQELGRRIRDEEKGTGSHQFVVESRKSTVKRVEIRKMHGQGVTDGASFGRNAMVQNYTPPPLDKRANRRVEANTKAERDKNKHITKSDVVASLNNSSAHPPNDGIQGGGSEGNVKKRKDTEANGFSYENTPRPNKMARPTSNILTENGRKQEFLQNPSPSLSDKQGTSPTNFKVDSKEQRVNGITSSEQVALSAKKPPVASANHTSSPPVITNHFTSPPNPSHTSTHQLPISSTKPPCAVSSSVSSTNNGAKPLPFPKSKQFPQASTKPPHPDTKYLNQILKVPKLEQWSGFDDQDWLFSSKDDTHFKKSTMEVQDWDFSNKDEPHFKKSTMEDQEWVFSSQDEPHFKKSTMEDQDWIFSNKDEPYFKKLTMEDQDWAFSSKDEPHFKKSTMEGSQEEVHVWFEARHIESVNVCALPYVIPY